MIIETLKNDVKFAIYGAQVVAHGAYTAIKGLTYRKPECFIVSKKDGNPDYIDDIPVKLLEDVSKDTFIIIGVSELLQKEISALLIEKGYESFCKLDSNEEFLLMSKYYEIENKFLLASKSDEKLNNEFSLFEVKHHLDKPINNIPNKKQWEVPIQAGASLADKVICDYQDSTGDNISEKNRMYSEATVMYWIWKNVKSEWVGVEHYRRHLLVDKNMLDSNVDAILSLPYICYPNVKSQFTRFVSDEVFEVLLDALKELHPNEFIEYEKCFNQSYHYAYNLMAVRGEVYNDYCEWVFGITGYLEKLNLESINGFRILGYIVEQLTSIYFIANTNKLKIKHVKKEIYV